jgi:hypothetical protein
MSIAKLATPHVLSTSKYIWPHPKTPHSPFGIEKSNIQKGGAEAIGKILVTMHFDDI